MTLCIIAAFAGAGLQSFITAAQTEQQPALADKPDLDLLAAGIEDLSSSIGQLQGRILAIQSQREKLSQLAGIEYSVPEFAADAAKSPAVAKDPVQYNPVAHKRLDSLADRLQLLDTQLSLEEDLLGYIDFSLSQQNGFQASLPTLAPVAEPVLSSSFGWRKNPVNGRSTMHEGLDFVAPYGTAINAASGGVVVFSGYKKGYGNLIEIDHGNGLNTRYAHISSNLVSTGDFVNQGQLIAKVGSTGRSTGAHLHFEVRMADYPLDPSLFINKIYSNNYYLAKKSSAISADIS